MVSELWIIWRLGEDLWIRIGRGIWSRQRSGISSRICTRGCLILCRIVVCILHVVFVLREDSDQELSFFVGLKGGWYNQIVTGWQLEATAHLHKKEIQINKHILLNNNHK